MNPRRFVQQEGPRGGSRPQSLLALMSGTISRRPSQDASVENPTSARLLTCGQFVVRRGKETRGTRDAPHQHTSQNNTSHRRTHHVLHARGTPGNHGPSSSSTNHSQRTPVPQPQPQGTHNILTTTHRLSSVQTHSFPLAGVHMAPPAQLLPTRESSIRKRPTPPPSSARGSPSSLQTQDARLRTNGPPRRYRCTRPWTSYTSRLVPLHHSDRNQTDTLAETTKSNQVSRGGV